MTLYKGQNPFEVELMPGEKRETLFTETIRRQSYRAVINKKVEPGLLTNLINMANDGSIQAEKILESMASKGLIDEKYTGALTSNTSKNRRGEAGPGFKGVLSLGPYVKLPDQQNIDEVSALDNTNNEIYDKEINDPYGTI